MNVPSECDPLPLLRTGARTRTRARPPHGAAGLQRIHRIHRIHRISTPAYIPGSRPSRWERPARSIAANASSASSAAATSRDPDPERSEFPEFSITTRALSDLTPLHVENVYEQLETITSPESLARALNSDQTCGIAASSSGARALVFGNNTTPAPTSATLLELVIEALSDFTVLALIGAAGVSITLELWLAAREGREANIVESVSILIAVAVVVLVSAGNNWQKEAQFRALEKVQSQTFVRAVREGTEVRLPAEEVVVGELLKLETGDILCADGVLLQGFDIRVDESHLTGESKEVNKDARTAQAMYSGSKVLCGFGTMMVTAVGRASQSGIIAGLTMNTGDGLNKGLGGVVNEMDTDAGESADGSGDSIVEVDDGKTTLQRRLEVYASNIGMAGVAAAVATTLVMGIKFSVETFVVQGQPWSADYLETYLGFFITGVTILVVAIPEGLPLAVTISLAYSVTKMLEDNNLVRHLSAAETMGTATVICTDKTGTLTQNIMTVQKMWFDGELMGRQVLAAFQTMTSPSKLVLGQAIALNSTAKIYTDANGNVQKSGNKTEVALLELLKEWEHDNRVSMSEDCKELETDAYKAVVVEQRPFTSESKRMTSLVDYEYRKGAKKTRLYTKGAAEVVMGQCDRVLVEGVEELLSAERRRSILDAMHSDSRSLRLLAVAYKDTEDINDKTDLVLLAVLGISDPLRPEVPGAIRKANHAGISVRMFTGDNPVTAASIATECGIMDVADASNPRAVVEGSEFMRRIRADRGWGSLTSSSSAASSSDDRTDMIDCVDGAPVEHVEHVDREKFLENWRDLKVLARCSPTDKYTVVESLKRYTDEIVAVTGDGTNDAPALRKANVGFAMNDGTQIAKEAADIILVDNNFASTISAALWGRNVYSNITKFLQFQLTVNIVALVTAAGGAIASAESPLTTVQMLWVNLIMDSLASLALATGRPDPALLDQKPYGKDHNFVDPNGPLPKHIIGQAVYQLAVLAWLLGPAPDLLGIPHHVHGGGPSIHHTLVFNTFVMMQLFNQLNARQIHDSDGVLANLESETLFAWVLCSEFMLQVLIVQYGAVFFNTTGLDLELWGVSVGLGAVGLVLRRMISWFPR